MRWTSNREPAYANHDTMTRYLLIQGLRADPYGPLEYPADMGLDIERGYLYVPLFYKGTVEVFRLKSTDK